MNKRFYLGIPAAAMVLVIGFIFTGIAQAQEASFYKEEQLGKKLFFDQNLSLNLNLSCAGCHGPAVGFTGPDSDTNVHGAVYEGSVGGAFGNRKPPSAAYAGPSPILCYYSDQGTWLGGMFWDGRATGKTMGDPLAEQAKGPFLNPKEQAIPDAQTLCEKVQSSDYAGLYGEVWGTLSCHTPDDVATAYDRIGRSIAAYERSKEVSPYSSKFDAFWDRAKGKRLDVTKIKSDNWQKYAGLGLNENELRGLAVFNSKAKCSGCHALTPGPAGYPLFTDFTYDNLGIPKNLENPATIADPTYADPGLGGFLSDSAQNGKFKVPTLRNLDLRPSMDFVKSYGHNGYFKSLEEIVHFYNTRDVGSWPSPETPANMNTDKLGNLGLSKKQEKLIVQFLKTLSDGHV